MYEGIKPVIYRLFPNVVHDNGIARRYNAALDKEDEEKAYTVSRQLIQLIAKECKDSHTYNAKTKQLKLRYDGGSSMEVDELNLWYYALMGFEPGTHTAICECCGEVFNYDTPELVIMAYKNLNISIPKRCAECEEDN